MLAEPLWPKSFSCMFVLVTQLIPVHDIEYHICSRVYELRDLINLGNKF